MNKMVAFGAWNDMTMRGFHLVLRRRKKVSETHITFRSRTSYICSSKAYSAFLMQLLTPLQCFKWLQVYPKVGESVTLMSHKPGIQLYNVRSGSWTFVGIKICNNPVRSTQELANKENYYQKDEKFLLFFANKNEHKPKLQ